MTYLVIMMVVVDVVSYRYRTYEYFLEYYSVISYLWARGCI